MRFLVDMAISPQTAAWLNDRGHDAIHASAIGLGRAPDRVVLDRAARENRVVVTADTDFPQLLALSGADSPGVILFRGGSYAQAETDSLLERVLEAIPESTLCRSICVVDRDRIRCRPLPVR